MIDYVNGLHIDHFKMKHRTVDKIYATVCMVECDAELSLDLCAYAFIVPVCALTQMSLTCVITSTNV